MMGMRTEGNSDKDNDGNDNDDNGDGIDDNETDYSPFVSSLFRNQKHFNA